MKIHHNHGRHSLLDCHREQKALSLHHIAYVTETGDELNA